MNPTILIGGPPGAGKTTLAHSLARHLDRKTITMDDLMIAARSFTTPESHPDLYLGDGEGHLEYFTAGPPERLIGDAVRQAEASWVVAERAIRSHQASQTELVMDHWLFEPQKIAAMDPTPAVVWLYMDPEALDRREHKNPWREGSSDPERMHRNFMARSLWRNEYLAAEAGRLGQPVLRLSGSEPPDRVLQSALELIVPTGSSRSRGSEQSS